MVAMRDRKSTVISNGQRPQIDFLCRKVGENKRGLRAQYTSEPVHHPNIIPVHSLGTTIPTTTQR